VKRRLTIQVKEKATGHIVDTIQRIPFNRGFVGNFVPVWVRYNRKEYLLQGGWDYAYMHGTPSEAWIEI